MIYKAIILAIAITVIAAETDPATAPCTPGVGFKYFCNQCSCSADGKGAACTKKACSPGMFNEDGTLATTEAPQLDALPELPDDFSCVAGQQYKKACNKCSCMTENRPMCTMMACE